MAADPDHCPRYPARTSGWRRGRQGGRGVRECVWCPLIQCRLWCVGAQERALILNWYPATDAKTWELYDLQADPGERRNVVAERPDVAKELRGKLERHMERRTTERLTV